MYLLTRLVCLQALIGCMVVPTTASCQNDTNAAQVLEELQKQAIRALESNGTSGQQGCTVENAVIRRDWEKLSKEERKGYISAVQCLMAKEPLTDRSWASAARNRYDDFVAIHANVTPTIHATGNFFTWHRYFLWMYEKALREECEYDGYQPYWNWFSHGEDLLSSAVFDGSDTSLGGDGEFVQHNGSVIANGLLYIPSGGGGGCIKNGPFKNMQVNIGPMQPLMDGMGPSVNTTNDYNPRCLRRDVTSYVTTMWGTAESLLNVTLGNASATVGAFQMEIDGYSLPVDLGFHGMGHAAMAADGADLYTSPNDPVFYLHHAMLDNLYYIWQALHPEEAQTIWGTITMRDVPPSRNATVDDTLDMHGFLPARPIRELLSTLDGTPLCYVYK